VKKLYPLSSLQDMFCTYGAVMRIAILILRKPSELPSQPTFGKKPMCVLSHQLAFLFVEEDHLRVTSSFVIVTVCI